MSFSFEVSSLTTWRKETVGKSDILPRVEKLDRELPLFCRVFSSADFKEREKLLHAFYDKGIPRVLSKLAPSVALDDDAVKLRALRDALDKGDKAALKKALKQLPKRYQERLCRVSSFEVGKPVDLDYLKSHLELLKTTRPYFSLGGHNIVDQMFLVAQLRLALNKLYGAKHFDRLKSLEKIEEADRMSVLHHKLSAGQWKELQAVFASDTFKTHFKEMKKSAALAPLYFRRGAHIHNGKTHFFLYAPNAKNISVRLTAFGAVEHELPMKKKKDGTWKVKTPLALAGRTYHYCILDSKGAIKLRMDPFSFSTIQGHGPRESIVTEVQRFGWTDEIWMKQRAEGQLPLSIYEVHLPSWKKKKDGTLYSFRELAPKLTKYCKEMGFSHIELYGVLDHESLGSWGYHVANYFAPFHEQGNSDDFKFLVNEFHKNNIGVILDWIPAHYNHKGREEASLHELDGEDLLGRGESPWDSIYLDYSKPETRSMLRASAQFWAKEMHVDGMRYDAIADILNVKENRGDVFFKQLNDALHAQFPGFLAIAENGGHTEEMGFDFKWGMGAAERFRKLMKVPLEERQQHLSRFFEKASYPLEKLTTHSHDVSSNCKSLEGFPEEKDRTLYKVIQGSKDEKFAQMRLFYTWHILNSESFLTHMGDELGQPRSWNIGVKEPQGAIDWQLLELGDHKGLQNSVAALNQIFRAHRAKSFNLIHAIAENGVMAFERRGEKKDCQLVILNFSSKNYDAYDIDDSTVPTYGKVKQLFDSDALVVGGEGRNRNLAVQRNEGATTVKVAIPPFSALVLQKGL